MTDSQLLDSIDALLHLDAKGALVPHGIGGHARTLLKESAKRIETLTKAARRETE